MPAMRSAVPSLSLIHILKKQIADDGKTIRVRDGIQALELLAELGISSVPAAGVRLSRGSLTIRCV